MPLGNERPAAAEEGVIGRRPADNDCAENTGVKVTKDL